MLWTSSHYSKKDEEASLQGCDWSFSSSVRHPCRRCDLGAPPYSSTTIPPPCGQRALRGRCERPCPQQKRKHQHLSFRVLFIVESVRDWGILGALRKGCRHRHLPFSGFHGAATYFISKIRKLYKLQHMLNNNLLIN